ncbi:SusD/RagB family nutrient-binding outer membrane lipoprotein [Dyadobacter sandarakinus]|uniref:SusD/RagB family nutrient-binding outer membrane lipoprotein n=1 Tax=Dyadobacter sandarakinus TaxID=2747268 RepID=A0ABX7I7R9_9BACT|nr:SusD/RagB family nutrient-binding outer membrane lipoprotein [Dyadobacter sandarakinus]QRR02147.1 SusD/RagB family nutrient-binding outer membrane lipoprotein [Dyadobacter sandarakinus]
MKLRLKICTLVALAGLCSCSDDELRTYDSLQQKNAVESVNDPYLLASIIKKTTLFYQKMGFDNRMLPGAVQHMESNYQSGDNFYSNFKSPVTDMYTAMDILKLIDGSIGLAEGRNSKTHQGIFKIFRVLLFSYMTDFYGDVYYSEALKAREGILYPKYDKQQDIYNGLLAELDEANVLMDAGTEPISESYDLMFAGDRTKWRKFSNSLRLRLLMHVSAKMADAGAKLSAVAGQLLLTEAAENASIEYVGTTAENSWTGGPLSWGTIDNFDTRRPCKTLVDRLASLSDPRMQVWFAPVEQPWTSDPAKNGVSFNTTDPNGYTYTSTWEYINRKNADIAQYATKDVLLDSNKVYVGFVAGMLSDWKNGNGHYNVAAGGTVGNFKVSKFSKLFRENKHPLLRAMIMNSDEVQFNLAEAAAKGLITGSADTYYRKGVANSLLRWGVSQAEVDKYLAQAAVKLPADKAGQLTKIAEQKWIALFLVSSEGYLDLRRTRLPDIFANGRLGGFQFPERYRYPGNELGQNKSAYDAGVGSLTPAVDDQFSKMWLIK